jgi:hypothetical protein
MNRILSLDGGGIRGLYTLEILDRVEVLLRKREQKPDLVLADFFNLIGGTSTGAILAAGLSWRMSIEELRGHYLDFSSEVFRQVRSIKRLRYAFDRIKLADFLQQIFSEADGSASSLGTDRLSTLILLMMRNGSSGSVWPVTNSPAARYNDRDNPACNLEFPLWQLVRASTAAPTFFPTESIEITSDDGQVFHQEFIDGAISPYDNPALRTYVHATLPQLGIGMASGVDNFYVMSVGTGISKKVYEHGKLGNINVIGGAIRTIEAVLQSGKIGQDLMSRVFGKCLHGAPIDSELGDLVAAHDDNSDDNNKHFQYVRYDQSFTPEQQERSRKLSGTSKAFDLADLTSIPLLQELGQEYGETNVKPEHLPDWGPGLGRKVLRKDGTVGEPLRVVS